MTFPKVSQQNMLQKCIKPI